MRTSLGIYVEIEIHDDLDHVWLLPQDPAFHERWIRAVAFTTNMI
jgi:hypothetical protein